MRITGFQSKNSSNLEILLDQYMAELVLFMGSICPDIRLIRTAAAAAVRATAEEMKEGEIESLRGGGAITDLSPWRGRQLECDWSLEASHRYF